MHICLSQSNSCVACLIQDSLHTCQAKGMLSKYRYKETGIYLCQKFIRTVEEPHSNEDKQAGRNDSRKEKKKNLSYNPSHHIKRLTTASTINIKPVTSRSIKKWLNHLCLGRERYWHRYSIIQLFYSKVLLESWICHMWLCVVHSKAPCKVSAWLKKGLLASLLKVIHTLDIKGCF